MDDNKSHNVWLKSNDEMLSALLADEAKAQAILQETQRNLNQLASKSKFRLALINQLIEKGNK